MHLGNRVAIAWALSAVLLTAGDLALAVAHGLVMPLLVAVSALQLLMLCSVPQAVRRLREQKAEQEYLALHDPVTELPNRILFHDRVQRAIVRDGAVAVLLIDLDRFKEVNDTLGHHSGDQLLAMVGARMSQELRDDDLVARLGGDEFAVLVSRAGPQKAIAVATRMRELLFERFEVEGIGLELEASVGIAVHPQHGAHAQILLQHADVAMYNAKEARSGVEVYSAERDNFSRGRLSLVTDLRRAMEVGEVIVHYQPKAALDTGMVVGVEALVRWNHPTRGLLLPGAFIPVAEHTGLMRPLTLHVLDLALAECRRWRDGGREMTVAVNLSTRNLLDHSLPGAVQELLTRHGVPPHALELEITETTIMVDPPRARAVLASLDALGITLAIDDFGTGYTSLSWLSDLPVRTLKIDRSFVSRMDRHQGDSVIVRSTVQLARNLGMSVVAEGVEHAGTWAQLAELGCELAQGYFLGRPMAPEQLSDWLATYRPSAADATLAVSAESPAPAASAESPAPAASAESPALMA